MSEPVDTSASEGAGVMSPAVAALTAFVSWYSAEGYGCDEAQIRLMRVAFVAGHKAMQSALNEAQQRIRDLEHQLRSVP